jgi:hypothetical protein
VRGVSALCPDLIAILIFHRLAAICSANIVRCTVSVCKVSPLSMSKVNRDTTEAYHVLEICLVQSGGVILLTNHMWAVVLIVRLALRTFHARLDLSANTDTISWLEPFHFWSNSQNLADNLVTNADG